MKKLFIIMSALYCFNSFALYEVDDRKEYYEVTNPAVIKVANAMAYQIEKVELSGWTFKRFWTMVMQPFEERGICSEERFSQQLSMRNNCSGILVSPKHLLTAGNCITEHYCWNDLYYWVFDYNLKSGAPFNIKHHSDNFYKCEKIVKRVFDPNSGLSYTLLELKKEVKGISPVKLRQEGSLTAGDDLIVLGHPQGLPLKIAANAQVYDQDEKLFLLNSDITGSNKGAAIINAKSHELEGIMIYGTQNYDYTTAGCKNAPIFPNNEAQELALKSSVIKELVNEL